MKTTKRLVGLLLAIVMVVGLLPLSVFAEVEVTDTLGSIATIGSTGDMVGMPEGVTPTYLSDIYNTDAKVYSYVVPGSAGTVRDFSLDQNFFGTRVYPFTAASDSNRYAVLQGASNVDADGYRTLANGVKVHYSDIVLGRNTTIFEKGLSFQPSAASSTNHATVIFNISDLNADYFYGVAGMTGEGNKATYSNRKINFEVYGSKDTAYSEDMTFEKLAYCNGIRAYLVGEFNVPITGYNYLKLVAVGVGSSTSNAESAWGGAAVYSVHDWKSEVTSAATCTEDGVETYTCANEECGETYTKTIPALGHSYESVVEDPTCTEAGSETKTCSVCGDVITEEIPATGHSFTDYVKNEDAISETAKCDNCDETDTRYITFAAVDVEAVADNVVYLSDVYNTEAKVSHYVDPTHDTDWYLDVNRDNAVYVYSGESSRLAVSEDKADENGYRTVNGVSIHISDIVLGWPAVVYEKGLSVRPSDVGNENDANVVFDISGMNADRFYAVVGMTGEGNNPKYYPGNEWNYQTRYVDFELWASVDGSDYTKLYAAEMIGGSSETVVFDVDISGYKYVKLVSVTKGETASSSAVSWANACVYSLDESECEHTWDEGVETTAVTCTTAGVMTYTCGTCSATKTVSIQASGHSFTTYAWDEGTIYEIAECDNGCGETDSRALPEGSENNPIVINEAGELASIDVAAGESVYYAINAQLNDQILTIAEAENVVITLNGEAFNGSAVLAGAPTNSLVVTNNGEEEVSLIAEIAYAAGTEGNPIAIDDMTGSIDAAAGDTYYTINSMYNGRILKVDAAEGVSVTVNGVALVAEEGYYTVELTGAPTNRVLVSNSGDEAVTLNVVFEYELGSEGNPIWLDDNTSSVEAAVGTTYYAINSMYSGMILTVEANENVTVTLNGEEVDASAGVELTGAPANRLVITNNGEAAVTLAVSIEATSEIELFNLEGITMTLGNRLDMNFVIDTAKLEGDGHYAVIVKSYADGNTTKVTVDQAHWENFDGADWYYFTFSGVAAKEMTDTITVNVYNADGEQVTYEWVDSVEAYCIRMLPQAQSEEEATLYVDMLNYGAAAQSYFGYKTDDLANADLTAEQQAKATQSVSMEDKRSSGTGYVGSALTLESCIQLDIVFDGSQIEGAATAVATYTDHYGAAQRVEYEKFGEYEAGMPMISLTGMSVADCSQMVTLTVYDAEGNVLSTVEDSVESYVARMTESDPLFETIMKFATSSYNYFH